MRLNFVVFCFCYPFLLLLFLCVRFSFYSFFVYTFVECCIILRALPTSLQYSTASSLLLSTTTSKFPLRKQSFKFSMETTTTTGSAIQSTSAAASTIVAVSAITTACAGVSSAASTTSTASASPARIGATTPASLASSSNIFACIGAGSIGSTVTASVMNPSSATILATSNSCQQQYQQQQQQQHQSIALESTMKQDDLNNTSLASGVSEGQRSLSAAPSASSSPILSPPGKMFGRNANGTMVATSRPSNEAEIQLYCVLQRASLLSYYDTLLEMGGDDVQQLYEAGEEEFLEIMALVGMASKPLHVRRLQKVLHEWANNAALFQGPMISMQTGICETPTKPAISFSADYSPNLFARHKKVHPFSPTPTFNPTPLINPASQTLSNKPSTAHLLTHAVCSPAINVPVIQPQTSLTATTLPLPSAAAAALSATTLAAHQANTASGSTAHQVTSSSPQLTPVLTEMQVSRITHGAEKIANQLPQREPRAQTSKKRTSRELEQVIAMNENDPRRMDEIRKYSAIYGRFDCKRRPEKPLTLHEVCVNEAAAQLCRLVPALLTRRDELFPLARQIVKDAGFGHSASIARYGGLLPQVSTIQTSTLTDTAASSQTTMSMQRSSVLVDCESSDSTVSFKRQRLSSTETKPALDLNRPSGLKETLLECVKVVSSTETRSLIGGEIDAKVEFNEDPRYNLFAMYQKFAKPPFDLSDIAKFSLSKRDFDDNDNDSRFSFSNSSNSPTSMPHNGNRESETDNAENLKFASIANCAQRAPENEAQSSNTSPSSHTTNSSNRQTNLYMTENAFSTSDSSSGRALMKGEMHSIGTSIENSISSTPFGGVQVISAAAAGHIIAVANPALALSPTLSESTAFGMKREAETPDE